MSYSIEIKRSAYKELEKLPTNYYKLIKQHIDDLSENPFPDGYKKLKGSDYENNYRIRVGVYRIVYEVISDILVINIVKVAHRSNVYK